MNIFSLGRIRFNLIFLIGSFILFSGCDKELNEIDESKVLKKLTVQEEALINSTNSLSLDILKAETEINQNKNFFFSPVSVGMALGMIYNGVGQQEKLQILQTTGLELLAENEINKSYNDLLSFLQASNAHMNISYANSLWFSSDININEDFRTKVMAYYDAEIEELNFNKSSSLELINHWGNFKTKGNFEKILDITPPKNTDIFLVNAFGLNTSWEKNNNYFLTKSDFFTTQGEKLDAQTMNWDGINVSMNENDDYSFIEFPFEGKSFFFSVIVPQDWSTISELMQSFSISDFKNIRENSYGVKANVSLPDIDFTNDKPMKSTLSHIGLEDIFSKSVDLSPSFIETNRQISEINQKSVITLEPDVFSNQRSLSFSNRDLIALNINKPFLYFVRDKTTKTVLFAGYYASPTN